METFSEKFKAEEQTVEEGKEKTEGKLTENLKFVIGRLNEGGLKGLKYSVVGGMALAALSGEKCSLLRENKTFKDLDVMILDDPENKLADIKKSMEEKREKGEFLLPVDFNMAKPEEYHSRIQLLSHLKKGEKGHYLVFRNVEKRIPEELLKTHEADLKIGDESVGFKTFEPGTLVHLYIQRVGSLKPKDRLKIIKFLRENAALKEAAKNPEEHRKYRVFHEFARELRKEYPFYSAAIRLYNSIDHALFKSLVSQKLVPRKLFRRLIDL